ncbi:MAG: protein kinase domain-containing protein, partial [bacterium]
MAQVVAVFEDSDPNRRAFTIQMPFYQYGHLQSWIETYAPRGRAVRRALADVLSALVYLHSQGIVHCDVKPPNILIAADERARLADFDISVDLKTRVSVRYAK